MQVINTTGLDLYVAALQLDVNDGETVDVDETLGTLLVSQGWKVKQTKPAKAADKVAKTATEGA